jgi:CubicO group peptidase (beta-lactamase class C family)
METFQNTSPRAARATLCAALALGVAACAPNQDPFDPDQAPDINYAVTQLKDAKLVGTIQVIDDEVLARMAGRFPGVAIAIADGGVIRYTQGYGVADFHVKANPFDDDPMTKDTVAGIGSVSKTLTATAVMRLAELGHLGLDTPIANYFPHWTPPEWNFVTVRQTLAHRGGFARDPNSAQAGTLTPAALDGVFGPRSSQHPRYGVLEFILTPNGIPALGQVGSYAYSNIGYVVLGAIVDWITTQPAFADGPKGYEPFVWSLFANAQDAALTTCLDHPWRATDIPNLAQSYDSNWNELDTPYSGWQSAPGGWSMTVADLARAFVALEENQILSAASLTAMRTNPGPWVAGTSNYGLGLFLESKAGRPAFSHGGLIDGFRTQVIAWPGEDLVVAVFANADRQGVGGIAEEVGRIWIEQGPFTPVVSRGDRAFMQSATYEVSIRDFAGAERLVRGLLGRYGDDGTAAWLGRTVGAQSSLGSLLVDSVRRDPLAVEQASQQFLDVLGVDGRVGPYRR